jgi:hypothetical protein
MTLVSFISRHRRAIVLCAATLALHFVTIDWLGARLGPQHSSAAGPKPAVMTAQLRLALPQRVASTAPVPELAASKPVPRPARAPRVRPLPRQSAVAAPEPETGALSDPLAGIAQALAQPDLPPSQAGAVSEPAAVQSPPDAPQDTQNQGAAAPAPQPEPVTTRRFKVNLPPSADFDMELKRTDANGAKWNGVASMHWHTDGSRYKVGMEAGISMLVTRVNLLVLSSEGEIDDAGIAPLKFTEKRKGRALTATHFVRDNGHITFSASERSYPLLAGAQDKATVPFQLGAIGRADVNQLGGDIDILVGEDKDASIFRFQLVGEEELETKMGRIVTWHLSRPPKPGSYSARLDIWLAPGLNWFPVQIRNTEANGALTTQTVTRITLSDTPG